MDELNLVPIYRNGIGEITPGIDFPIPNFCQKKFGECSKCRDYYLELEKADAGIHTCPYGYNSYIFNIDGDNYIFTCLMIENEYDKKKVRPRLKNEYKQLRELTKSTVKKYAETYILFLKSQTQYEEYRDYVEDLLHDIRKFNGDVKAKNDRIYKKASGMRKAGDIAEASRGIVEMGWFITVRLSNHDFIYNEDLMATDMKSSYNIYDIFYKVRKCLAERWEAKFLDVKINANRDCSNMQAYDCIELLPYLIIDNAIKYSLDRGKITVIIEEKRDVQYVTVESIGPYCPADELEKLTDQCYRGENAKKLEKGRGIGLYTTKRICELNNISYNIKSDDNIIKNSRGVDYSKFCVEFTILL